ncbi:MAG: PAS domain S-box protein [Bacteroidetes bacterium]|nr:PAS domain S-box protein [Bacteroidota bacterium]
MLPSGEFSLKNNYHKTNKSNHNYSELVELIKSIESDHNPSTDLIFVTDCDNKFLYANNTFLKTYQYTIAELLNIDFNRIFFSFNHHSKNKNEADSYQYPLSKRTLSLKKDNTIVDINIKISPVIDGNGEICGYKNIISQHEEDITLEEKFLMILKELKHSFKNFPDIYIKIDKDGNIYDFKYIDLRDENYTRSIVIKGNINTLFQQATIKKIFKSFKNSKSNEEIVSIEVPLFIDGIKKIFKINISLTGSKFFLLILRDITKIIDTENAIKKTMSRFYALWNYSADGMRLLNKSGIIIAVNPAFCKLVEMHPKDLLGKPFYSIYSESDPGKFDSTFEKINNAFNNRNFKSHFEGEFSLKCNKKKYFDVISTVIESQTGNPLFERDTFLLSIFRDITERKKTEENIIILKHAVESSGEVILLTDKEGIITYVNSAFTKIYGYEKDEVVGKVTPRILKSGKVPSEQYEEFWETLFSKKSMKGELINKTKDGQELYIEGTSDPIINERDEITGFLAVQRNITDRKKSEDALRNSELLFRSIWEKSHDGMRLSDANGNIVSVNKAFCKLVGMSENKLMGKPFYDIYKQNRNEEIESLNNYKKFFSERKFGSNRWEHKILHNGKSVFLDVSFSLIELNDKEPLMLSVFRDDTKYKKIEEELHKSERLVAIGTMSAFLSHEIKKPASAIKGYVEMLYDNNNLSNDVRNTLGLLYDAVGHLNKLLADVLLFSQNKELIKIKINLKNLVDKVYELLSKKINERNIKFINAVQDIFINGDYFNLISIFTNLIENSMDAVSLNGEINIFSELNDNSCSVYIKDNGCGIIKKEKIFDPFYTTKSNGTGLGLSIVKKILEYHNGSINLISSEPGATIFEIKFKRKGIDGEDTYN